MVRNKDELEKTMRLQAGGAPQPANSEDALTRRSWRALVTMQHAAKRAKMTSL